MLLNRTENINDIHNEKLEKSSDITQNQETPPEKVEVSMENHNDSRRSTRRGSYDIHFGEHEDIFTASSSHVKPKLRSSMYGLIARKKILNPVESDMVVRLPWPNDSHEDAAWISGHHLSFTSQLKSNVYNFCFLCGSAGQGKVKF